MNNVYNNLNYYLNEMCNYLDKNNSFLLDNISRISKLNDMFLECLNKYDLNLNPKENKLTSEEVYILARKIIKKIDNSYLEDFDNLIKSGELDFNYEQKDIDSECITDIKKEIRLINVNRRFNYNDVVVLVHEFIHYTNAYIPHTKNKHYFCEFLSIYFELYAIDYLIESGISQEEIDYLERFRTIRNMARIFFNYEIVFLAFLKFGNLNQNTINYLKEYIMDIKEEQFNYECKCVLKNISNVLEKFKVEIENEPSKLGMILSEELKITNHYRYILGTTLAVYAKKYGDFNKIVYLNNHLDDYNDKSVYEVCLGIGIDLEDKNFLNNLLAILDEYINKYSEDKLKK